MPHVLVISLGPIQDFIASARRCQDLWFGSYLLSELARATAQAIAADALVFPDGASAHGHRAERPEGKRNEVANKVVAVLPGDADAARAAAEGARASMERKRDALMAEAFRHVPDAHFRRDVAERQVRELIEFVWVAVPFDGSDAGYKAARRDAERLLAARKNTRRWAQPPWGEAGVPKSSLDGLRESVVHESLYPKPGAPDTPELAARRRACGVEGMERLCGVGLLKRVGRRDDDAPDENGRRRRFASTSHLAALPWMVGLDRAPTRCAKPWADYRAALDAISRDVLQSAEVVRDVDAPTFGRVDGQVFFEGRLLETLEECGRADPTSAKAARKALVDFLRAVKRDEPQGYYAVLHADGDRMGSVIDRHGRADHVKLSEALVGFAARVYGTVRAHQGSLVYSGGDDVLALLPLHRAVDCADALRRDFARALRDLPDDAGRPPTLSAGLAVVHHLTPFDAALDVARRAEQDAKLTRDALTVLVDKRGGAEQRVSGHWDELVPTLKLLRELHRLEVVSSKTGHALAELARLTDGAPDGDLVTLGRVAHATARQLFDAKRARGGAVALAEAVVRRLVVMIPAEPPPATGDEAHDQTARRAFADAARTLGDRLVLAQQLARVADEAGERQPASLEEVLS